MFKKISLFSVLLLILTVPFPMMVSANCPTFPVTIASGDNAGLINAIACANTATPSQNGSTSIINLSDGGHSFTSADNSGSLGGNAVPVITGNVTIRGRGVNPLGVNTIINLNSTSSLRFTQITSGGRLTIEDVRVLNGNGLTAGGMFYNEGILTINDSVLVSNNSTRGGAINTQMNTALTLNNTSISNSTAVEGAAIYAASGALVSITDGFFTQNSATQLGGAMFLDDGTSLFMDGTELDGNRAPDSAGIHGRGISVDIDNAVFFDNVATKSSTDAFAGAITLTSGGGTLNSGTITDTEFAGNATQGAGAAIRLQNYQEFTIEGSTFNINTAGPMGGAIWFFGGELTITSSPNNFTTFTENRATDGGAIFARQGRLTIDDTIFDDNTTTAFTSTYEGGAIHAEDTIFLIDNTRFTENTAGRGGAIFTARLLTGFVSFSRIRNSTFDLNSTGLTGGAVHSASTTVVVDDSTFSNNTASGDGGAIYTADGAIGSARIELEFSTFVHNTPNALDAEVQSTNSYLLFSSIFVTDTGDASCGSSYNSRGRNITTDDSCDLTDPNDDDLENTNPQVNLTLTANAGRTPTHNLLSNSPAIDNVPFDTSVLVCPDGLLDQIGNPRGLGLGCDSGAVESGRNLDPNSDGIVSPVDAIYVLNRVNGSDFSADANGDDAVNATDVVFIRDNLGTLATTFD